jgi:hypothetical protein
VDSEGGAVGVESIHTAIGEDFDIASVEGSLSGRYCAVVDGLANAQGSYELTITRSVPQGGVCASDEDDGRNDFYSNATSLVDISNDQGLRFEQRGGRMCSEDADPYDWYTFPVATEGSRICAMLEGFSHAGADLDLELYTEPILETPPCMQDSDCVDIGADACMAGHCQADKARSTFEFDFEMLDVSSVTSNAGPHYLRVKRGAAGAEMSYDVRVTVTPNRDTCLEDWQEFADSNDRGGYNTSPENSRATVLGSGEIGVCDAWLCNRGPGDRDEDWYKITVPSQEDRTVIIRFESEADGQLDLLLWGETDISMGELDVNASAVPSFNYQCINIEGGSVDTDIELGVDGIEFLNPNKQRVDYSLRIVPTDLETNPGGACELFGAGVIQSCGDDFVGGVC